jgi:1-deoxy-D-xylulose-5-phosphate reductoisomerase
MISQLGLPDMRTPISYAMRYPDRLPLDLPSLDLTEIGTLTFCKPDHDRFPCLRLGYESLHAGGTMPAAMNAANEIAVDAFLNGGIRFTDISDIIQSTMQAHTPQPVRSVEAALEADRWAREKADSLVHALAR